jgi:hypothetical protein
LVWERDRSDSVHDNSGLDLVEDGVDRRLREDVARVVFYAIEAVSVSFSTHDCNLGAIILLEHAAHDVVPNEAAASDDEDRA